MEHSPLAEHRATLIGSRFNFIVVFHSQDSCIRIQDFQNADVLCSSEEARHRVAGELHTSGQVVNTLQNSSFQLQQPADVDMCCGRVGSAVQHVRSIA
jgi:hypothetical protein